MKKLILIDSNALVHRAFHALPPSLNAKGIPTNAIFGFTSLLIKMIKEIKPDYIAATFDLAGPTFRHEEFEEYKSHRVKAPDELYNQIPPIKEILKDFGIPIFEKQGFEADDLIGALAEKAKKNKDLQVVIMTGDLDTLQLVEDDKVVVLTLRKGLSDTMIYNEKEVKSRYNLKPSELLDFKGLKGDPSDNIPGVPGIGEKTASVLIGKYKSLEKLYETLENPKKKIDISPRLKDKLLENKDQAFFSKKLATIIRNIDLDFNLKNLDWKNNFNQEKVEAKLKELAFYSLVKRLNEANGISTNEKQLVAQTELFQEEKTDKLIKLENTKTTKDLIDKAEKLQSICFGIKDDIVSFSFDSDGPVYYGNNQIFTDNNVKKIFESHKIAKIVHDAKDMIKILDEKGIKIQNLEFDTKLAAYILDSEAKDYELDKVYYSEFGRNMSPNPEQRVLYIFELAHSLREKLKSEGLANILEDIELPLSPVLARMEEEGVLIDKKSVQKLAKTLDKEITGLEKNIFKSAGTEFNINSPQQLSQILFEKLELKTKVRKTGKGALSTAASELEKLIDEHPIVPFLLKYRELQKLKTTYIEPFPELIAKDGRIHTTYIQTGTTTGRLASQNPNLQNIPIKTELGQEFRKSFIADKGKVLLSCDYSQLELRIAAYISGDKKMTEAFKRGEDIHTRTAAEVFNVSPDKVTKNMRREAKVLNFGVLYGMGLLGFQRAAGVNRAKAREFIDKYMDEFSGLAEYIEKTKDEAHKKGFVSTIFGRKRQFHDINSRIPELVRQAERMAVNMPIQGTAADLIKLAMIKISELLEPYGQKAKMLLQVHDELLFEMDEDLLKELTPKIKKLMEGVKTLNVPITVDAKFGNNWAEMRSLSTSDSK